MGLNSVNVKGRLKDNVKLITDKEGNVKAGSFTIAVNDYYKDDIKTAWVDCIAFGKTAEVINKWFGKGKEIIIIGKLQQSSWEKDGVKYSKIGIAVNGFDFCGKAAESKGESDESELPDLVQPSFDNASSDEDELPF